MEFWSWLLTAVGVTGLWLAGRKNLYGWAIGIGAQVLWVAFALSTQQYGFLVSAGAYGWVYTKNFLRWRAERAESFVGETGNLPVATADGGPSPDTR